MSLATLSVFIMVWIVFLNTSVASFIFDIASVLSVFIGVWRGKRQKKEGKGVFRSETEKKRV